MLMNSERLKLLLTIISYPVQLLLNEKIDAKKAQAKR